MSEAWIAIGNEQAIKQVLAVIQLSTCQNPAGKPSLLKMFSVYLSIISLAP